MGGPVYDTNRLPGCESFTSDGKAFSCRQFKWNIVPEYLEEAGISWRVYQDLDNYLCDTLDQFEQYLKQNMWHVPLARKGLGHPGFVQLYEDVENGNIPKCRALLVRQICASTRQ